MDNKNSTTTCWGKNCKKKQFQWKKLHQFIGKSHFGGVFLFREIFHSFLLSRPSPLHPGPSPLHFKHSFTVILRLYSAIPSEAMGSKGFRSRQRA